MLSASELAALSGLPGLAGSPLPAPVVGALPSSSPAPPWRTRVEAVLWWHRAVTAAGTAAGVTGPLAGRRVSWLTVGAFVRYLDSPVGPYSEVFASPVVVAGRFGVPAITVPFIAVDSLASIHGGRAHWALPKVLASFTHGTPVGERAAKADADSRAQGDGWSVAGTVSTRGPRLFLAGVLPMVQPFPDASVRTSLVRQWGWFRPGHVEVSVTGVALEPWLLSGRHRCVQITGATMALGAPRSPRPGG